MKLLLSLTLSLLIQFNCSAQYLPDSNYVYSVEDTIQGQIETAIRLKYCMDNELYDIAIILFSEAQQKKIIEFRNEKEKFDRWCFAWYITDAKLDRYISRIKKHKGSFIFENGEWKIDEN